LYELGRLVEEDRASFDDEEFRELIDEGIHEHIETRLEIRAEIAMRIRASLPKLEGNAQPAARRVLNTVEDTDIPLRDVALVLKTYATYLFQKLEACADQPVPREAEVADRLFDSLDDRSAVEAALGTLGSIRSAVSSRILAHVISEPMLEEDLEMKAYHLVRAMWPLPRHYIVYSLKSHDHDDIPFRWFQILVESSDAEAVDSILEEVKAHIEDPDFREDLLVLIELLSKSSDPDTEEKLIQVMNDPETSPQTSQMLEQFLKTSAQCQAKPDDAALWEARARQQAANKKYQIAARLLDSGRKPDAIRKLDDLLRDDPQYPFAVMLKEMV